MWAIKCIRFLLTIADAESWRLKPTFPAIMVIEIHNLILTSLSQIIQNSLVTVAQFYNALNSGVEECYKMYIASRI